MTISSPSAETVRFIAQILSVRATSVADLPATIAAIQEGLRSLEAAPVVPAAPVIQKTATRIATPPAKPKAPAFVMPVRPEPTIIPAVKRGRGRPRRVVFEAPEPEIVIEQPAPQPKLLRRAQVHTPEPDFGHSETAPALRTPQGTVRGVVKWYDSKAGKGVLRLTGVSGDVAIDPAVLTRTGIKRLYKDQEIEAVVEDKAGRVQLVSLALPGRKPQQPGPKSADDDIPAILRRTRQVLVEVKQDGGRKRAARAEAEQLLGGSGTIKMPRRLTP